MRLVITEENLDSCWQPLQDTFLKYQQEFEDFFQFIDIFLQEECDLLESPTFTKEHSTNALAINLRLVADHYIKQHPDKSDILIFFKEATSKAIGQIKPIHSFGELYKHIITPYYLLSDSGREILF